MDDHSVAVDAAQTPTALAFAGNFNVAVPFIDRHLAEGRGDKVAIRDAAAGRAGDVTYAALAAQREPRRKRPRRPRAQPRRPRADGGQGLPPLLLSVLGRDQGGLRAGPAQHPAAGSRLSRHRRERARRLHGVVAGIRRRDRGGLGRHGAGRNGAGRCGAPAHPCAAGRRRRRQLCGPPCRGVRRAGSGAGGGGRCGLLALHLRLDRHAQGRRPPPSRHGGDQPVLRCRHTRRAPGRHPFLGRQAVLRLRPRQRHDLPAVDRRHGAAQRRPADARDHLRRHRGPAADDLLRRADVLRRAGAGARAGLAGPLQRAPLRLGRRAAAGAAAGALACRHRARHRRRPGHDREPAHLHLEPPRRGRSGRQRHARARLRCPPRRR